VVVPTAAELLSGLRFKWNATDASLSKSVRFMSESWRASPRLPTRLRPPLPARLAPHSRFAWRKHINLEPGAKVKAQTGFARIIFSQGNDRLTNGHRGWSWNSAKTRRLWFLVAKPIAALTILWWMWSLLHPRNPSTGRYISEIGYSASIHEIAIGAK
jgi:hypothetical protein